MWWLNTDGEKGRMYPAAPPTSYSAQGAGGNYIWMVRNISLRRISLTINEEEHLPRQARDRQTDTRTIKQGARGWGVFVQEPTLDLVVVVRWCGDFKGFTAVRTAYYA
jgi:hypothetical protein